MKAGWFETFGPAADVLQLGEQPTTAPTTGEVLVRLHSSGVNPSDVKKRAGAFPNLLDEGLVIPNSDGAGIIEAVGEGVDASRVGERVWVYQAQYGRRLGTTAEYVAHDACRAVRLPQGRNGTNASDCAWCRYRRRNHGPPSGRARRRSTRS